MLLLSKSGAKVRKKKQVRKKVNIIFLFMRFLPNLENECEMEIKV